MSVLMWKIIHKKTPSNLNEKLDWDPTTRKIRIKEPRLQFTEQNFMIRSSRDWNNLPDYLRENESLMSFKNKIKLLMHQRRLREPD